MGRWLNLELMDSTQTPLRNRPFAVRWEGGGHEGETSSNGLISLEIPHQVSRATLEVAWRSFELDFSLPPADEVTGAQARLNQLNFPTGPVDGVLGPITAEALRRFQRDRNLAPSGELDAPTVALLVKEHGT